MRKKRERRWLKTLAVLAVTMVVIWLVTGCDSHFSEKSEEKKETKYTDAQIMLVAATEKNRYSEVYTDQMWQVQVSEDGATFQDYLLEQVQNFFRELKTMNLLADQQEISLSSQERDKLKKLSKEYYESLTDEDRAYIGASEDDVYQLYEQCLRANRLVEELTKDVNLEISDSEAKVIAVQEIVLPGNDQANEIYNRAVTEGTDFEALAKAVSQDPEIEKLVGRGERSKKYEDVVFALKAGEVGPVIRDGEVYYIVKCINEYDEEATQERKRKLTLQRKNQAFRQIYDVFSAENPVDMENDIWQKLSFTAEENSTTTTFFSLYQEYME